MPETDQDWLVRLYEAMETFSPGAPIDEVQLFADRPSQTMRMIETLFQKGQHAVLFGERGVGKSSLANIFAKKVTAPANAINSVIVNCDASDSFTTVWRKVFRRLFTKDGTPISDHYPDAITTDDVLVELEALPISPTQIIILDEFDQLRDPNARLLIAHTIKNLSDRACRATVVVVGVADSVDALIADHKSVERCLRQIQMPRMSSTELTSIIDRRLANLQMGIEQEALAYILALARGLPHYAHLFGQQASMHALRRQSLKVELKDVQGAMPNCVQESNQTIRTQYHAATNSPRKSNIYKEVLLAAALSDVDDLGYFQPASLCKPLAALLKKDVAPVSMFGQHLKVLCAEERGEILQATGVKNRPRYRFSNTMMQPYILMNGLEVGLITNEQITALTKSFYEPPLSSDF